MAALVGPQTMRPLPRTSRRGLKVTIPKSSERDRNDSGCFDEDSVGSSGSGGSSPESVPVGLWEEIIGDWAIKSHSIISQEMIRMQEMTRAKRKQMAENPDPKAQAEVVDKWKAEMADMMEITQDLIQCVANDIVETNSSCGSSTTSMTSQDLGKILEEELFEDIKAKKVFLVRTKKKRRARNRKHRSRNSKDRRDSAEIEIDGKVWHSQSTFTIQVDEIDKSGSTDEMTGSWLWRKDLDSPVAWEADDCCSVEHDNERRETEVEDIFSDWLDMQKKKKVRKARAEINDVFWNISLDPRQRRISQVLDNLPFADHPDVFSDRCELLEGSKGTDKRKKKERPKMSYWNIFNQWKRNLDEDTDAAGGKLKKSNKLKSRRKRKGALRHLYGAKKRAAWLKRPRHNSIHIIEDYYNDFIKQFDDRPSRRRGSIEMEKETQPQERSSKRQKIGTSSYKENWEVVKLESNKSFDFLTKNIEQKIREAFSNSRNGENTGPENREIPTPVSKPLSKPREEFENLPKSVARRMRKSHRKFTKLRIKVRKVREANKRLEEKQVPLDWFHDWMWNFEEKESLEDIFADCLHIFDESDFSQGKVITSTFPRSGRNARFIPPRKGKSSQLVPITSSALPQSFLLQKTYCSEDNQHNLRRVNRHKADKFANRLRTRCQAKQPMQRGRI